MNKQLLTATTLIGLLLGISTTVQAYSFTIDNFEITRSTSSFFNDDFGDGNPPPSSPTPVNNSGYTVQGTVGPEANGKLTLDSSGAVASTGATGNPVMVQGATLRTNIDNANTTAGLKNSYNYFQLDGLFDLIAPGVNEAYGIQFSDRVVGSNDGNDILELAVTRDGADTVAQFRHLSFIDAAAVLIDSIVLDTSFEQIMLRLFISKATNAAGDLIQSVSADVQYYNSGAFQGGVAVGTSNNPDYYPFHGEEYTRARFFARQTLDDTGGTIPEPATLALMGLGLAGLGFTRSRKI